MNINDEHGFMQSVIIRKLFDLSYHGIDFDEVTKEDFARYIFELENQIRKLKDPNNTLTSKNLVKSYLRSYEFTPSQARLLKLLSDSQVKMIKELTHELYRKKYHPPEKPKDAIRKLVSETNKTIELSGSSNVFKIKPRHGGYYLSIDATNLSINLKKPRLKNPR